MVYRKPKKRGGKDEKLGISNLKIAVVVAQDCNGQVIAKKAGTGRVRAEEIDAVIGDCIDPSSLLCKDTLAKRDMSKKALYHLQHVTLTATISD